MKFVVVFSDPTAPIPPDLRQLLLSSLREVGATLATVPAGSAVWTSIEAAPMFLTLAGWRFVYTIDRQRGRITVKEFRAPV